MVAAETAQRSELAAIAAEVQAALWDTEDPDLATRATRLAHLATVCHQALAARERADRARAEAAAHRAGHDRRAGGGRLPRRRRRPGRSARPCRRHPALRRGPRARGGAPRRPQGVRRPRARRRPPPATHRTSTRSRRSPPAAARPRATPAPRPGSARPAPTGWRGCTASFSRRCGRGVRSARTSRWPPGCPPSSRASHRTTGCRCACPPTSWPTGSPRSWTRPTSGWPP